MSYSPLEHFLSPFVQSCPAELYDTLLGPLLTPTFNLLLSRLVSGWLSASPEGRYLISQSISLLSLTLFISEGADPDGDVTAEIVHDKILRDLTRFSCDWIRAFAFSTDTSGRFKHVLGL